jgi:hypothetical protein
MGSTIDGMEAASRDMHCWAIVGARHARGQALAEFNSSCLLLIFFAIIQFGVLLAAHIGR